MYKTVFEHLQNLDNVAKIRIILTLQMYLLFKKGINCCYHNLLIANKIKIVISDKYDKSSF